MEKTELYFTNLEAVKQSPVWGHIDTINKFADKLINDTVIIDHLINYDYIIEIIKLRPSSFEDANYWIKLNMFLSQNPNHTFTLMTLRCSEFQDFPVSIDMNYFEYLEISFCDNQEGLLLVLEDLGRAGFEKMTNSILKYLNRSKEIILNKKKQQFINKKESSRWTTSQDSIFLEAIDEYRAEADIQLKDDKEVKKVTRDFAYKLKKQYEDLLIERNEYSIAIRLAYFDELLAGVGEPEDYQIKDQDYFGKKSRYNGSIEKNPARVRRKKK